MRSKSKRITVLSFVVLLAGAAFSPACTLETEEAGEESVDQHEEAITSQELALAQAWAPILYQDVSPDGDHSQQGRADHMVALNYDGDFNAANNWDRLGSFPTFAQMYTAVTESDSHFFIYYMAYHPRDWSNDFCCVNEHENDGEGAIFLVRKNGTTFGSLEAVITTNHEVWAKYSASPNVGNAPRIAMESWASRLHPELYQEFEGHGMVGCTNANNCGQPANNDVIKYRPIDQSQPLQQPAVPIPAAIVPVGYRLLDFESQVFKRRFDRPTFANPDTLAGNDSGGCGEDVFIGCQTNAANGVWSFRQDGVPASDNDGAGEDPAALFAALFTFNNGLTPPSNNYVTNKFLHAKCTQGRRMKGSADSCVQRICASDPFCCNNAWDSLCVGEVGSICGNSCANCRQGVAGETTFPNVCVAQGASKPIGNGCDSTCANAICAVDPFCCQTNWDGICVGEVASVCGLSCSGL